ncbi:nitroreductase family protein [Massilia sp. R2A-15]|uniref:nitroreductase family protein n=1 Tax=Massilia sp. R2A-15 TaxID=3064278 RepID=UPI002736BB92|nr:nitroreductase family protein [Massilia sp. R2A-15]WLI88121.1 nitroreductase family protein [Massilia sp. R2A-15]
MIGIREDADQSADIDVLLERGQIVLPVRFHGAVLDIGPVLATQGGSHYEDYRHSLGGATPAAPEANRRLLADLAVQMLLLLNARTVPLQLNHNLLRFSMAKGQPRTERLPLLRGQPLLATLGAECRDRLTRQARIAVPSLNRVGTKTHEGHYAPENLAVAKELPVAIGQAALHGGTAAAGIRTAVLLEVLECAFGYRSTQKDIASRLCPTGGNLGSPECLVLVKRNGQTSILRYIPLKHQLELVHSGAAREEPAVADSIHVVCIGNREKTTRKYHEFGENLACIDAGVALAFFKNAAEVRGLAVTLDENGPIEPVLDEVLSLRTEYYRVMWTSQVSDAGLGPRLGGTCLGARRKLEQRVAARKACRLYDASNVQMKMVVSLLREATPALSPGLREQALAQLTVVIRARSGQRYHLHALTAGAAPSLLRLPLADAHHDTCLFMQTRLAEAPVQLFFLTPLHRILERHGPEGHDASLSVAGEWVARLWLRLAENGLAGCPCGAVVEDDLLAQLPPQFARHFNLFAFVFGRESAT